MKPTEFFKKYALDSIIAAEDTAIFPSVMLAQAALESGWGESGLTKDGNALFGIKAAGKASPYWNGDKYTAQTKEYINGVLTTVQGSFRKYRTVADSLKDYIHFLKSNPRYEKNGVFAAQTPEDQARALQTAGYAGSNPNYATKLINMINQYNLKQYDQKKKQ